MQWSIRKVITVKSQCASMDTVRRLVYSTPELLSSGSSSSSHQTAPRRGLVSKRRTFDTQSARRGYLRAPRY